MYDSSAEGQYRALLKGKEARKTIQRISPQSVVEVIVERIKYNVGLRGWKFEATKQQNSEN